MRNLPPLNALRAFESAARHQSFRKAAAELFVTPAAISQHVKALESWLDTPLFQRQARGLVLTAAGRQYLPQVSETLDRLAAATEAVRRRSRSNILTVNVTPGFASLWLGPRLWSFAAANPGLDIRVTASGKPADFESEGLDVAIRYGRGDSPDLHSELLLTDGLTPICSPWLQEGPYPLNTPEDLRHHTLLHNETPVLAGFRVSWQDWLETAGVKTVDGRRGLYFSDFPLVLQETLAGRGVGLGHLALVGSDIRAGRLVQPFKLAMSSGGNYFITHPPGAEKLPRVAAFLRWLRQQAAAAASVPAEA